MSKKCTKCGIEKPLSEFHKSKNTKDGLRYWCKDCASEHGKQYRSSIKGIYKISESNQKFFHRHSSEQSKPFKITFEDFKEWYDNEEKKCAYCYLPEKNLHDVNDTHNNKVGRLTIDCKNNELGYVNGNIVLACNRCNFIKNDFLNYEQMFYYGQTYIKPIWEKRLGKKLL